MDDEQLSSVLDTGLANGYFELPLSRRDVMSALQTLADGRTLKSRPQQSSAIEGLADYTGKRVLVADDSEVNLEVACEALRRFNIIADIVSNGLDACEAVEKDRYDLVLMDVHMPEMDGLEATRKIRELDDPLRRKIKIIAMTASVLKSEVKECIEAGMDDYIGKPFNSDELYGKIVALIGAAQTAVR